MAVAELSQLKVLWLQGYMIAMTRSILSTGQDTDSEAGDRLRHLLHAFCCTHCAKARVSPRDYTRLVNAEVCLVDTEKGLGKVPDWTAMMVSMQIISSCMNREA